jgi:hypothetical protein
MEPDVQDKKRRGGFMNTITERLARCDREIALAVAQRNQPHTDTEHSVLLRCERDRQSERERILSEMVLQASA